MLSAAMIANMANQTTADATELKRLSELQGLTPEEMRAGLLLLKQLVPLKTDRWGESFWKRWGSLMTVLFSIVTSVLITWFATIGGIHLQISALQGEVKVLQQADSSRTAQLTRIEQAQAQILAALMTHMQGSIPSQKGQ